MRRGAQVEIKRWGHLEASQLPAQICVPQNSGCLKNRAWHLLGQMVSKNISHLALL